MRYSYIVLVKIAGEDFLKLVVGNFKRWTGLVPEVTLILLFSTNDLSPALPQLLH